MGTESKTAKSDGLISSISTLTGGGHEKIPASFMDLATTIQRSYSVEVHAEQKIDEEFFTTEQAMEFFGVGFRVATGSFILPLLFTPLALMAVLYNFPIFGNPNPSTFDKAFVLFSISIFSLGYSLFYVSLTPKYITPYLKKMFRWLLGGMVSGAFTKLMLSFYIYHFLAIRIFTENNIYDASRWTMGVFQKAQPYWNNASLYGAKLSKGFYLFFEMLRPALFTSAWFVALIMLIFVTMPIVALIYQEAKNRGLIGLEPEGDDHDN